VAGAASPGGRDARAVGLRYVGPDEPGLSRRRAGRAFAYRDAAGRPIRSTTELARIKALAIPPAWSEVWICPDADGHLQATGRDARGRRQYRYHARFRARRDRGKFARLIRFGRALPRIRRRVRADLRLRGLPRAKVIATVISLLETTRFRVGNAEYARLNRSFGLATLRDRHARVSGDTIHFRFRGKGGRPEERALVDAALARTIRRCQDLPGQLLFQYVDADGEAHGISSEDVNAYLREAAGADEFSAKDFRTWAATVLAYRALQGGASGGAEGRPGSALRAVIDQTAAAIGDSAAVTRNSYVHPAVVDALEQAPGSGNQAPKAPKPGASSGRNRGSPQATAGRPPTRRDELAVLRFLRSRDAGAARRP
jgi:DNA topoisomerase-1